MKNNNLKSMNIKSYLPTDRLFKAFCKEVRRFNLLSEEQEKEAIESKNYELLVNSNLRIVIKIAHEYSTLGDIMDLIQAGCVGITSAARKYDPSKGLRFANYASWWIRHYILEYLREEQGKTRRLWELALKVRRYIRKYENENGFEPSDDDVQSEFEITSEYVRCIRYNRVDSLDAPVTVDSESDDTCALSETLGEEPEILKDEETEQRKSDVQKAITTHLNKREQEYVNLRFGSSLRNLNMMQIAEKMGVTRQYVHKIAERVKEKLSQCAELRKYAGCGRLAFLEAY